MGNVAQAVLEFDEEVQAPWRPRLVVAAGLSDATSARAPVSRSSRRGSSRVGVCRPPVAHPSPTRRPVMPSPQGPALPAADPPRRPAARRRPAAPASGAGLRLTRRARRLAVVMALAAGVAMGSWLGPLVGGDAGGLRLVGESSVVVQSGDTLWSIASSLGGDGDVRTLIDEIQALNGLRGADLVPGQTLFLP